MKKLTLILMAALLVTAVGSCKKDKDNDNDENDNTTTITTNDGVFNPSKKIYKYFYWDEWNEEKRLNEVWHWEGKRLSSIDHMNWDGTIDRTEYFTYDNNRLARVDYGNSYTEFHYSDGRLNKVYEYYNYELETEFSFSYGSNGKVDVISGKYYDFKKESRGTLSPLNLILPKQFVESIEQSRERRETKRGSKEDGMETFTAKLTWNGDNISKYEIEDEYSEDEFYEIVTVQMIVSYDNKHNPIQGFMNRSFPGEYFNNVCGCYSRNNMTQFTYTEHEMEYENGVLESDHSSTHEGSITYRYDDDDYPIVVTQNESTSYGSTYTDKYYFEYL